MAGVDCQQVALLAIVAAHKTIIQNGDVALAKPSEISAKIATALCVFVSEPE